MSKIILIFLSILILLSGCDESLSSKENTPQLAIKNKLQKAVRESATIIVSGKSGDKLYVNSKLLKGFTTAEDVNISLKLEGKDGLKQFLLELEDANGNFAKPVTLKIYKDTTPPQLKLLNDKEIEIVVGSKFIDPGYEASDNIDEKVNVTVESDLNSSKAGSYTIQYKAIDSAGNSIEKERIVTVQEEKDFNFAPQFSAKQSEIVYKDNQEINLDLNTLFSDKNGDTLQFTLNGLPEYLTLSDSGVIQGRFPQNASKKSPYSIKVTATDKDEKSAQKEIKFIVKNVAPLAKDDSAKLYKGKTLLIDVLKNDSDADGDTLELVAIDTLPKHGKAIIKENKIEYSVDANYTGADSLTYTIEDSDGSKASAKVTFSIKEFKNIPIVYLSQDTWDRDNYTLIAAAKKMHQRELIELHSVDVTGKDAGDKVSNVFRGILGDDVDIPVLINHSFYGRVTPTSSRFPEIKNYVSEFTLDSDSLDSTEYILADLENIDKEREVVYVVGGHLHNFASLLLANAALVNEKVDRVVISSGWQDRVSGKPEMNLSEGVYKETSTSKASKIVFSKFKGEIIMSTDPDLKWPIVDTTKIDHSSALWYFVSHGTYNNLPLDIGDFPALLYGAVGENWYGHHWTDKRDGKCSVTNYGAIKLSGSGVKCSYLDNVSPYYTKAVLEELLYRGE